MTKVTITKQDGTTGTLTLADDGKWDIELNGQKAGSAAHYTDAQVDRIIRAAIESGATVTNNMDQQLVLVNGELAFRTDHGEPLAEIERLKAKMHAAI
jgi:hypothetical protein